jgi:predicted phage tail protein
MLHIAIEKGRRWDLALACASLSLVTVGCSVMMGCCSALASAKPLTLAGRSADED